jgi:hypothetical protein
MRKLFFKYETDDSGPVYWHEEDGSFRNYMDSEFEKMGGGFFAKWFTLEQARKIAEVEGVELETF